MDYTAFERVWYGAKYSHRVWEQFAHTFEKSFFLLNSRSVNLFFSSLFSTFSGIWEPEKLILSIFIDLHRFLSLFIDFHRFSSIFIDCLIRLFLLPRQYQGCVSVEDSGEDSVFAKVHPLKKL